MGLCWSWPVGLLADVFSGSDVFTASDTLAPALSRRPRATTPFRRDKAESLSFLALPIGRHNLTAYGQAGDASHKCSVPPAKPPTIQLTCLLSPRTCQPTGPKQSFGANSVPVGCAALLCAIHHVGAIVPCGVHVSRGPSKADRAEPSARKGMSLFLETYGRFTIRIPHQIDAGDSLFLMASSRLAEVFSPIEQRQRRTCRAISLSVAGQALAVLAARLFLKSIAAYSPHAVASLP